MNPILELKDISYTYSGEEKPAIQNLNLKLFPGEKVAVLGRNGMGKSTLFLNINGVYVPTSGEIILNGKKLKNSKKDLIELRKTIGLVFQDPDSQFIAPTVEGEISFGILNLGFSMEDAKSEVTKIADYLNITHLLLKSTYALSGGEKKLVSIASVMIMKPKIILFDEPTAGIDYQNEEIFKETLKVLEEKNIGIVISTHDMDFAWEWADRVILLKDGNILYDGKTEEVFTKDSILESAGISKPSLVKIVDTLKLESTDKKINYPKTYEELREFYNKII